MKDVTKKEFDSFMNNLDFVIEQQNKAEKAAKKEEEIRNKKVEPEEKVELPEF